MSNEGVGEGEGVGGCEGVGEGEGEGGCEGLMVGVRVWWWGEGV